MNTEDLRALKVHGYVFDSDSVSGGSNSDLDDKYYALKPPPMLIDPAQCTVVPISCQTQELDPPTKQTRKTHWPKRGRRGNRWSSARGFRRGSVSREASFDPPSSILDQRIDKENPSSDGIRNTPTALINTHGSISASSSSKVNPPAAPTSSQRPTTAPINTPRNTYASISSNQVNPPAAPTSSQRPTTSSKKENVPNNFPIPTISQNISDTFTRPSHKTGTTKSQNLQGHNVTSTSSNLNIQMSALRNTNITSATSPPSHRSSSRAEVSYTRLQNNPSPRREIVDDCLNCCSCQ